MGCPRLRWHLHVCSPLMRHWFGQNIYMRQANIVHVHATCMMSVQDSGNIITLDQFLDPFVRIYTRSCE